MAHELRYNLYDVERWSGFEYKRLVFRSMMTFHKKNRILFVIPWLCLLVLTACQSIPLTADTLPWVSDEPVLFQDNFAWQSGGWSTHDNVASFAGYDQSGFRMRTDLPNYQFWSVPGLHFRDTLLSVRTRNLGSSDDNLFGLICRYQDADNFNAFLISSDGYFGFMKRQDGVQSLIGQDQFIYSEAILQGQEHNDLQAICQGEYFAMVVNGARLLQVQDDSFPSGDVGLIIGNLSDGEVDILFDDFIVIKP